MTVSDEMNELSEDGPKKRSDSKNSRDKSSRQEKSKHLSKVNHFFIKTYFIFKLTKNLLKLKRLSFVDCPQQ